METAAENLVHRSGNLTDKHLDGVWVWTTVIRPVPHPLPVPHPVHHKFHFAPFLQNSGSLVTLCYSVCKCQILASDPLESSFAVLVKKMA